MAEGGNVNEDEIERMAEAVMTLRRSGLFSVEPLDAEDLKEKLFSFPVDSDGPGDFVCTRRGRAYRKEPDNPKSDSLLGENPFKLPTDFDASRSVKTPLFPPTDRRGFNNAKLDQQLEGENLFKLPTGFCASPPKESPLISPAGFARVSIARNFGQDGDAHALYLANKNKMAFFLYKKMYEKEYIFSICGRRKHNVLSARLAIIKV